MRVTDRKPHRPVRRTAAADEPANAMGAFTGLISRLAPGEDPERVEATMRHTHGSLQDISPTRFAREVKVAVSSIHASDHSAP